MSWRIQLKKRFRSLYYYLYDGSVTIIQTPKVLKGTKWLIKKENDRAYFKGYYEPEITRFLTRWIKPDDTFFDIGSHVGYFSLLAARLASNGHVVSFEPNKSNIEFINEIMNLNHTNNWRLIPQAVSDANGRLLFKEGPTSSTGKVMKVNGPDEALTVETISLDEFIRANECPPNIIKIDVEGHGDNVLEGFSSFENMVEPCLILIEIHDGSNELQYLRKRFRDSRIMDLNKRPVDIHSENIPDHVVIYNK